MDVETRVENRYGVLYVGPAAGAGLVEKRAREIFALATTQTRNRGVTTLVSVLFDEER